MYYEVWSPFSSLQLCHGVVKEDREKEASWAESRTIIMYYYNKVLLVCLQNVTNKTWLGLNSTKPCIFASMFKESLDGF